MLDTYQKFLEKRQAIKSEIGVAPYNWFELPNSVDTDWLPNSQMLDEHARELANSLNEMRQFIVNLKAWSEVLEETGEDLERKHPIIFEFARRLLD